MYQGIPMLSTIIWILFLYVVPSLGHCYYSKYGYGYYYCYSQIYLSVGSILGIVIGSIFGIIVLVVIIVVVCSQIKTRGVRGTVVNPINVSTVQHSSSQHQQPSAPQMSNYNYNQYPPPSGSAYPPPPNMAYPPPGQNYGQPPVYTGTPMKH